MSSRNYRSRTSRNRSRQPRRRKARWPSRWPFYILTAVVLIIIVLVGSMLIGFNPLLEGRLKAEFGDAFFSDFGVSGPSGSGDDLESIVEAYTPAFEKLEDTAMERLDDLLSSALDEYKRHDQAGNLDRFKLANKYIQAGRMLEDQVDKAFDGLITEMETDLLSKGLPIEVTEDLEKTYEEAKAKKKQELFKRLRDHLGEDVVEDLDDFAG